MPKISFLKLGSFFSDPFTATIKGCKLHKEKLLKYFFILEIPYILGNKPMGLLSEQNIFFGNKPMGLLISPWAYARTKLKKAKILFANKPTD